MSRYWIYAFALVSLSVQAATERKIPEELLKIRDPFKRIAIRRSDDMPRSELELYPSEKFLVAGILTGPEHLRAMLVAPNGKAFFVSERQLIGTRKGVITNISTTGVKVREHIVNVLGQEEEVDIVLPLPGDKLTGAAKAGGAVTGGPTPASPASGG